MTEYQLGDVKIEVREAFTTTRFPDGKLTVADHSVQPTQEEMAAALGMTVQEMNETHDLTHSLLAHWLGMPCSPTLHGLATGTAVPFSDAEKAAVIAIQRWAKISGVDLLELAKSA